MDLVEILNSAIENPESPEAFITCAPIIEVHLKLPKITIIYTSIHYLFFLFCTTYEIIYIIANKNKYLNSCALENLATEFFDRYIDELYKYILLNVQNFLSSTMILLFLSPIKIPSRQTEMRKKLIRGLEIFMAIYINIDIYLNLQNKMVFNGGMEIIGVFLISSLLYMLFNKKFRIFEVILYGGLITTIILSLSDFLGIHYLFLESSYSKLLDEATPEVISEVKVLCQNSNVDINKLFIDKSRNIKNSFTSTSINGYFFVMTEKFLKILSPQEIASIFAHEIGHSKDPKFQICKFLGIIEDLFNFFIAFLLFRKKNKHQSKLSVLICLLFILNSNTFLFLLVNNYLSRKMEFYADDYASKMGYKSHLSRILMKISNYKFENFMNSKVFQIIYAHPSNISRINKLKN